MTKSKLIIFDIDGTLIDSVSGYHEVIINAMMDLGIEVIDTDFNALKHHTDSYALKYNYENFFTNELPTVVLNDFEKRIVFHLKKQAKTIAIKGVDKVLAQLKQSEYAFAFATGSLPESAILKMNSAASTNTLLAVKGYAVTAPTSTALRCVPSSQQILAGLAPLALQRFPQ